MAADKNNTLRELFVRIGLVGQKKSMEGLKKFGRGLKSLVGDVKIFKANLAALTVAGAFNTMTSAIKAAGSAFKNLLVSSSDFAAIQEDAEIRLRSALEIAGDFSEAEFKRMKDFASSLQLVSTIGDEVAISALAMTKAFGATNDVAMEMVTAATQLSSALGRDFDSTMNQLAKSLGGYAGELTELLPSIKSLTMEQLKQGKAAELVNKQFGGIAQKNMKGFSSQVKTLSAVWGDLKEAIGKPINEALLPFIKTFRNELRGLTPVFEKFGRDIGGIVQIAVRMFEALGGGGTMAKSMQGFSRFLLNMALLVEDFFFFLSGERSFLGRQLEAKGGFGKVFQEMLKGVSESTAGFFVSVGKDMARLIWQGVDEWWQTDAADSKQAPSISKSIRTSMVQGANNESPFGTGSLARRQIQIDITNNMKTSESGGEVVKSIDSAMDQYKTKEDIK